ncbi:response regulator [Pseudaestuariivita atlantica]|uniref:response regulator n=1 Tax=Pseudaestuariivita atlantica TaxID=1317121 RepID=UPI0024152E84|nr:response regulator [Pseudaestuariivita atlantica]
MARPAAPRQDVQAAASSVRPGWARGRRILVVDDNATNRLVIERFMADSGAEITFATNGQEAVDTYKASPCPTILMDVSMPAMNGLRATEIIRGLEGKSGITPSRIIALTANAHQTDRDAATRAGMDAFLTKPLRKADLVDALMSLFGAAPSPA